jgi:SAM-dependent methyltransferase
VSNLSYARRKARALGIRNILFIRADYFAPPFQGSLDRLLCLDTLIRGEGHDFALLTAIANSLKPTGCAIVDFHNWWHNPLRRLGLLPENFSNNRSYGRAEAENLLRAAGIEEFSLIPFLQEFDADSATGRQLARIVPPTRLVYRFAPGCDVASP